MDIVKIILILFIYFFLTICRNGKIISILIYAQGSSSKKVAAGGAALIYFFFIATMLIFLLHFLSISLWQSSHTSDYDTLHLPPNDPVRPLLLLLRAPLESILESVTRGKWARRRRVLIAPSYRRQSLPSSSSSSSSSSFIYLPPVLIPLHRLRCIQQPRLIPRPLSLSLKSPT